MTNNPQNLKPGDKIATIGEGWPPDFRGRTFVIDHIDETGQARFSDGGSSAEWVADEQPGIMWAVAVLERAADSITPEPSILSEAIHDMTHNPWERALKPGDTPAQRYNAQRNVWLQAISDNEPHNLPLFVENYPPRTDMIGSIATGAPLTPAEQVAEPLLQLVPDQVLREQLGSWAGQVIDNEPWHADYSTIRQADRVEPEEPDMVNHPPHYTSDPSGVECIEVTRHRNFNVGNAIKYLWRAGLKADADLTGADKEIQDLEKAIWYLTDEIARKRKVLEAARKEPLIP